MRRILPPLMLAGLAALCFGEPALARDLPPEVRRMAERAFLEGRLRDLDTILAGAESPADRFPLLLRDVWWRRARVPPSFETRGPGSIAPRLAWLAGKEPRGPYPASGSGGDAYPILTALVRDRQWREVRGHRGLPQQGPLEALAESLRTEGEDRAAYFAGDWTRRLMSLTYRGPPPHPDEVRMRDRAERLRLRSGRWALIALCAFLVLALGLRWAVLRKARATGAGP